MHTQGEMEKPDHLGPSFRLYKGGGGGAAARALTHTRLPQGSGRQRERVSEGGLQLPKRRCSAPQGPHPSPAWGDLSIIIYSMVLEH